MVPYKIVFWNWHKWCTMNHHLITNGLRLCFHNNTKHFCFPKTFTIWAVNDRPLISVRLGSVRLFPTHALSWQGALLSKAFHYTVCNAASFMNKPSLNWAPCLSNNRRGDISVFPFSYCSTAMTAPELLSQLFLLICDPALLNFHHCHQSTSPSLPNLTE